MTRTRGGRTLLLALAIYAAGWAAWPPGVLQIADERAYLLAALSFSRGEATVEAVDPVTFAATRALPSTYPPGTSLLEAPLVLLFGIRGGPLASLLCLLGAALLTARLLSRLGHDPGWALLLAGYLPLLVLGRAAMSDCPSTCAVALFVYLLWTGGGRRAFLAGLAAGLCLLLRESNLVFVLPLCLGALWRRQAGAWLLAGGLAAGLALRTTATALLLGAPFYSRFQHAFTAAALLAHLPYYLLVLCTLAPLGLLWALAYRGPRRAEVVATVVLALLFFSAYDYGAEESGPLRRLILGPRYFAPLLPLLSVAAAEAAPRLLAGPASRGSAGRATAFLARLAGLLSAAFSAAVLLLSLAVHPLHQLQGAPLEEAQRLVCGATSPDAVLVGNTVVVAKAVSPLACPRALLERASTPAAALQHLERRGPVALVFLEREGTSHGAAESERDRAFLREAAGRCTLLPRLDRRLGEGSGLLARMGAGALRLQVIGASGCK
jgi:hypothetical protein